MGRAHRLPRTSDLPVPGSRSFCIPPQMPNISSRDARDPRLACILLTSRKASDKVSSSVVVQLRRAIGKDLMRKSAGILLVFILIGGMLGGIFGEILRVMAPSGTIQNIFASYFSPGINPPLTIDLVLLKLTFGFSIKVNLLSILGMFLGAYLYKQM
jgi:hypothetical protein